MARITPSSGRDYTQLRNGDWYVATLVSVTPSDDLEPSEKVYGDSTRFDFEIDGHPEAGAFRVWGSHSINNRPGGGPTKLRAILNSLLGENTTRVIEAFEDGRPCTVEYKGESARQVTVGQKLEARLETVEKDGMANVRMEAFRAIAAVSTSRPNPAPAGTSAPAVPF